MPTPIIISTTSTKGGVGKTTLTANLGAYLADLEFKVLLVDTDVQPSLSKFYKYHSVAPNGIVELLLGDNSESLIRSTISETIYPNLHIIQSNNLDDELSLKVAQRADRAFLLKNKFNNPYFENYDVILIDTQGSVGPIQDAAMYASQFLISPIKPETLSAREFIAGTQDAIDRLKVGANMGLVQPKLFACIYAKDRTNDAKFISEELKGFFAKENLDNKKSLLTTEIPHAKAFNEAVTLGLPVHCHERERTAKRESALEVMSTLATEIFPMISEVGLEPTFFNDMQDLLPEYIAQE